MIHLHNGHDLEFANASGAVAWGYNWPWHLPLRWLGLFPEPQNITLIIKTLTIKERKGNLKIWSPRQMINLYRNCVQKVWAKNKDGKMVLVTVNRIGLTNRGLQHWVDNYYPRLEKDKVPHIVSVMAENVEQAHMMGWLLNKCRGMMKGIEINYSCPNTGHRDASIEGAVNIVEAFDQETDHPKGIKMAWQDPHVEIARELQSLVEWVTLINTIPWNLLFPDQPSPFVRYGPEVGGVSGEFIRPYAYEAVQKHIKAGIKIPVMGCGGITKPDHVYGFRISGAKGYQIGTLYKDNPFAVKGLIRECQKAFNPGSTSTKSGTP